MKITAILSCIILGSTTVALPEGLFERQITSKPPLPQPGLTKTVTVTITTTKPCTSAAASVKPSIIFTSKSTSSKKATVLISVPTSSKKSSALATSSKKP